MQTHAEGMFHQPSRHLLAQSGGHIKLTIILPKLLKSALLHSFRDATKSLFPSKSELKLQRAVPQNSYFPYTPTKGKLQVGNVSLLVELKREQ